jgi:hypothetical protein
VVRGVIGMTAFAAGSIMAPRYEVLLGPVMMV